jgi:hypothetical protein
MSENKDIVEVGGVSYQVIKTGRAQAKQVMAFTRWLTKFGVPAFKQLAGEDGKIAQTDGLAFIGRLFDVLTEDALIGLFSVLIGCPSQDAEDYFDVSILIDTVIDVYENQPSLRRLLDRFFSNSKSPATTAEPYIPSEQPTDGQTTKS